MEKDIYEGCPIRHVISVFSDKWSLLVLTSLSDNHNEAMRYSEIQRQMTDCSQKMLSQTLKKLQTSHLISRKVYPVIPPKVEYALTPLGQSLMPHVNSLVDWALRHYEEVTA